MNINIEEFEYVDAQRLLKEILDWKKECSEVVANILDTVLDIIIDNAY